MNKQEKAEYIFHSNKLAGITLSLEQTQGIVNGEYNIIDDDEILGPDGKSYEVEVVGSHLRALNFALGFTQQKKIDKSVIIDLHKRLMKGLILSHGEFRECNIRPANGIRPFIFQKIPSAMDNLTTYIEQRRANPPSDRENFAWQIHHEFSLFHPFVDGNGRTARLLYNLVRNVIGLPAEVIYSEDRESYMKSILDYQKLKLRKLQQHQS